MVDFRKSLIVEARCKQLDDTNRINPSHCIVGISVNDRASSFGVFKGLPKSSCYDFIERVVAYFFAIVSAKTQATLGFA